MLVPVIAALLALVAYVNVLRNPFVFDDESEVVRNPSIEHLGDIGAIVRASLTRPVVNLSYAFDYAVWDGRDPFGFHLTNVALHVLNVLLVFVLTRRLVADASGLRARAPAEERPAGAPAYATLAAFAAAGLFAVHPVLTEAVGYVSSRSEVLATSFFLASLLCFRQSFSASRSRWLVAAIGLFVLAMGARETAVMLPFVLIAAEAFILRGDGQQRARLWRLYVPFFVLILTVSAARAWLYVAVEHRDTARFPLQNGLIVLDAFAKYLTLFFVPRGLTIVHAVYPIDAWSDPRVVTAAGLLALIASAIVLARKGLPVAAFGLSWFLLLLIPSSVLILLANKGQPMAEHRVYLASCGLFLAAGSAIAEFARSPGRRARRVATLAALCTALAVLCALTIARNRVWSDPVRLWGDAVEKAPSTFEAYYGLADAYRTLGDHQSAELNFQRAIALRPELIAGYRGLTGSLLDTGQVERAAEVLRLAILRVPADTETRLQLAALEESSFHDRREALRLCREALAINPRLAEAEACVQRNQPRRPDPAP